MAFNIKARTIIQSATLELDTNQLIILANAAPHLRAVCEAYEDPSGERTTEVIALDPVMELLSSIASLVDSAGAVAKAKSWSRKPKNQPGA